MAKPTCMYYLFDRSERQNVEIYGVRTNPADDQDVDFLVRNGGSWRWVHENNFEPYREGYYTCH